MTDRGQSDRDTGDNGPDMSQMMWRQIFWIAVVVFMTSFWMGQFGEMNYQDLAYSQLKAKLRQHEIAEITFRGDVITGSYRDADVLSDQTVKQRTRLFTTTLPPFDDPELVPLLEEGQVIVNARTTQVGWGQTILVSMLPLLLVVAIFYYSARMMRKRMGGGDLGLFTFRKSRARRYRRGSINLTFEDVAGLENAKRDLHEIIDFLKTPGDYVSVGAKIPKGILLMGAPGTGKTLLARAVAGEADVPFYSISASEFIEMFVGVGASRVRDMFEAAKKESPSIIFIDEIDSVGRTRGSGLGGGHDEREQTLNQILSEMDGFSPEHAVVVLAATNRPDVLDPALLRPGRFDRKITLELPLRDARLKILKVHARRIPLAEDVDLDNLAARTVGFSGADLENLLNEAALLTGREKLKQVTAKIIDVARNKIVLGAERDTILSDDEKVRVAYHEAGHALLAVLLEHADPVAQVSIIPRGRSLGATEQMPEKEHTNLTQSYLLDRITIMLGGRVAEKIIYDEYSSGAEEDIKQATNLARHMVSQWGMSEKLGPVAFRRGEEHIFLGREMAQQRDFSEHTAEMIDEEVRALVCRLEQKALKLLNEAVENLKRLARSLQEREVLDAQEVMDILGRGVLNEESMDSPDSG
jgi:cell division protease FtsH